MSDNSEFNHTYLQKHQGITKERLRNFMKQSFWSDINLLSVLWKKETSDPEYVSLEVWSPKGLDRPTFEHAVKQTYKPTKVGESFGPSWSTHWFKVRVTIPADYAGEQVIFQFDPDCEGMVWTTEGHPVQGLTGGGGDNRRVEYILTENASAGEKFHFYVEIACNGLFGNGNGLIKAPDENKYFSLLKASVGVKRQDAWHLLQEVMVIVDMAHHIGNENPRGINALYAANEIANVFDRDNLEHSIPAARKIAKKFLSAEPAKSTHQISAIGNCHIDTAWLWMYDETKRKTARSFASQLNLMDRYPEYIFAASQAQQFEWLEQNYPHLFKRVRKYARKGQFVVIGGTWVEMDCNLPSGESLVRQFMLGQRYFMQKFDTLSKIFWLPDTFGYAAQIPQIVKKSGGKYFFTQKLSWNNINTFPNTTFKWVGLDGSSIITHMAPANTYTGNAQVEEIARCVKNHKDLSSHNTSLYLYGLGDGGGGPQDSMIERIRSMSNTDGLPMIKHRDPIEFYDDLAKNARSLPSWHGELYFELHRGTYTTQPLTKKYNRMCEVLLRTAELLATLASSTSNTLSDYKYPHEELLRLWKLVCLNQFHDVIPGSSIEHVYRDSDAFYEDVIKSAHEICRQALVQITCPDDALYKHIDERTLDSKNSGGLDISSKNGCVGTLGGVFGGNLELVDENALSVNSKLQDVFVVNSCAWKRSGIVRVYGLSAKHPLVKQVLKPRKSLSPLGYSDVAVPKDTCLVVANEIPGMSVTAIENTKQNGPIPVSAYRTSNGFYILENLYITAKFNKFGHLVSLVDRKSGRNFVPKDEEGNRLVIYEDIPLFWDGWDVEIYHSEKYKVCEDVEIEVCEEGPVVGSILIKVKVGEKSKLQQWISLSSTSSVLEFETEVDWKESHKMLKAEFNWDIKAENASYETQFGYISRPTHRNTSWDLAKFEVCGHKFVDLSEYGAGVSVFNDCKYGHSCLGNKMTMSLLRSSKAPDANADMKVHTFRYGVYVHTTSFPDPKVIKKAYGFNNQLLGIIVGGNSCLEKKMIKSNNKSVFKIENASNVILDTVKLPERKLKPYSENENQTNLVGSWKDFIRSPKRSNEGNEKTFEINKNNNEQGQNQIVDFDTLEYENEEKVEWEKKKVVLRMYESCGGHAIAELVSLLKIKKVVKSDLLENELESIEKGQNSDSFKISIKPFEIVTLIIYLE
ncbi:hypothetical protein BB560_005730 [Smittium megazygosporum]|uniref:Alpha-mannosidase n=1 Tax=Smittium megazygosporum TaxID=133381 RepID=A0A2T9YZ67_9FUNG|nr:hypothetical protein BB560_005730 [Smittium megazygosporum]